jgi:predicted lipoprotein
MTIGRRQFLAGAALVASVGVGALVACRREGAAVPDRGRILADLSAMVIVPAYAEAVDDAKALETALAGLASGATTDSLAAARAAWKKARASWKVTDAFLFGPADDLQLTAGAIDTAPADAAKLEALSSAATPLDAAPVGSLGANMRGFPGIEVLLFDPALDDAAILAKFQAAGGRRGTLAGLLGADLRGKIEAVRDAWAPGPVDFGGQLARAGRGSTVYGAERQGVDAVVNALISAAEILIALRLAKPLGIDKAPAVPAPELIESPRSDASIDDLLSVLQGIEDVYLGHHHATSGQPLADAVADRSPGGDERMRAALQKAGDAVRAIPGPLRTAVVERRDPVIAAYAALRELKRALATDVAGALGTSLGFTVTDGD